jgi:tRNA(Ile)-lysidine synthase
MTNGFLSPEESLEKLWPLERWRGVTLVASVSGGADSVAMLRLLEDRNRSQNNRASIVVAHFNHQLRGAESDQDEQFVRRLAAELGLVCVVQRSDRKMDGRSAVDIKVENVPAFPNEDESVQEDFCVKELGDVSGTLPQSAPVFSGSSSGSSSGSEELWRQERYRFLEQAANRLGARYVVLGHHAEDRVETLVHHLFRGTGIEGLTALRPFRSMGEELVIARPLLLASRQTVREYLRSIDQAFREDSSNNHRGFTRNRLRHELLPAIEEAGYTHYAQSLLRLADQATEIQQWLDAIANEHFEALVSIERTPTAGDSAAIVRLAREPLGGLSWPVQRAILSRIWKELNWSLGAMTQTHWLELRKLIASGMMGAFHLPGAIEVKCDGRVLTLRKS